MGLRWEDGWIRPGAGNEGENQAHSTTAAGLNMALFFLLIFTALALESTSEQVLPQRDPYLTGCVSSNMETFRCRWNVGTFQNLSKPGELRLFYMNMKLPLASSKAWIECPHYSTDRPNECFFNESHTFIWTFYSVQLRSKDQTVLYDENLFYIEDIVQPDPPVDLNWTLLNLSTTGTYYDVMLNWRPPQSADVEMGWMTLEYEVHYRTVNSDQWKTVDLVKSTHRSLYGLQSNVNHEVRVRCTRLGWKKFGEFSDSIYVHVSAKESKFPVVALLTFGALCLVAILMLFVISQQEKLMVILLPPVPGPKIRGIDSELLKKGKMKQLTSILGSPPDLRPELYSDPWVEFIDLDIEEQNDRLTGLDPDCLMERSLSSNCSPLSIGFRDDDSGHASCCDPDFPIDSEALPFHPLMPDQTLSQEPSCQEACEKSFPVQSPTAEELPSVAADKEALYTQVSEVESSGKVLLLPEAHSEMDKATYIQSEKDIMDEKDKEKKEFQLFVVSAENRGYTSELNAGKISPRSSTGNVIEPCQTAGALAFSDTTTTPPIPPSPVYTMVEGVDIQNSLVLTRNSTPAPPLIIPKATTTPDGYLTPELLGSVTP
ncbi:growth hormone receptor-like isoform X2 [Echeneis naucrates]|uniref:growth hormone receptor-like isoform X2 n=1 Tax=Echeneis naucrates TaxID=173247 RepID=UPI0011141E33|nr:growth hormone receptor-like isoform X2 [Echeneis naucrates]